MKSSRTRDKVDALKAMFASQLTRLSVSWRMCRMRPITRHTRTPMVIWAKRPGGRDDDRLCGRREAAAIEAAGCVFRVVGDMRRKQDDSWLKQRLLLPRQKLD